MADISYTHSIGHMAGMICIQNISPMVDMIYTTQHGSHSGHIIDPHHRSHGGHDIYTQNNSHARLYIYPQHRPHGGHILYPQNNSHARLYIYPQHSRSRRDVMRLSNKRSPYLFGVATANRTKVTTPNKYGAEIIARMSDWENRPHGGHILYPQHWSHGRHDIYPEHKSYGGHDIYNATWVTRRTYPIPTA